MLQKYPKNYTYGMFKKNLRYNHIEIYTKCRIRKYPYMSNLFNDLGFVA